MPFSQAASKFFRNSEIEANINAYLVIVYPGSFLLPVSQILVILQFLI